MSPNTATIHRSAIAAMACLVVAVSAGAQSAVAWGDNTSGHCTVPTAAPCTAFVDVDTFSEFLSVFTDGAAAWSYPVYVPADPSLVGLRLSLQIALFNTAGPLGVDLSNGLNARVGY